MIMKIAVCDDSSAVRKRISEYITQYADQFMLDFQIETFQTGADLLDAFQKSEFKIIFLDIIMDGISGVETAYRIRKKDSECMVVFITTSPDFMAEGFDLGAVHYLLKPLTYKMVEEALNRCKRLFIESEKYLSIVTNRHTVRVRFKDILYIEVYGKCTFIHTLNGSLKTYNPLFKIATLLIDGPFLECHRCYIVNMCYISDVLEDCFKLDNGEKIPIRRKGRQAIKDGYYKYFLNSMRRHEDE